LPLFNSRREHDDLTGKAFVVILAAAGLMLAYRPPATILLLATQTFSGLAVLFPTVFFGLYLKRVFPPAAIMSIICGESALLAFHLGWLSTAAVLPVIWVMAAAFASYIAVHIFMARRSGVFAMAFPWWLRNRYVYLSAGIFLLAMDIWNWGRTLPAPFGIPAWVWYFVVLSALQTLLMYRMVSSEEQQVVSDLHI